MENREEYTKNAWIIRHLNVLGPNLTFFSREKKVSKEKWRTEYGVNKAPVNTLQDSCSMHPRSSVYTTYAAYTAYCPGPPGGLRSAARSARQTDFYGQLRGQPLEPLTICQKKTNIKNHQRVRPPGGYRKVAALRCRALIDAFSKKAWQKSRYSSKLRHHEIKA